MPQVRIVAELSGISAAVLIVCGAVLAAGNGTISDTSAACAAIAARNISVMSRLGFAAIFVPSIQEVPAQNQGWPEYVPSHQVFGTIRVSGSPQMSDLVRLEEVAFQQMQPAVRFENDPGSTLTAVTSVGTGRAEIGLLGREIWTSEQEAFTSATGHSPTVIEVATGSYDVPKATFALMIFVNRANPVSGISLDQLARIFSSGISAPRTWSAAGLTGVWAAKPIHLYGFARDNDKAQIFSRLVFSSGQDWASDLHEFRNIAGPPAIDAGKQIVQAVTADPDGIGISNVHYTMPGVRVLPIAARPGAPPIAPSRTSISDRTYPLTRAIYVVFDGHAETAAMPAVRDFLFFVLSHQGQAIVAKEGNYIPLTPPLTREQRVRMRPTDDHDLF